jgi:hypothetical protein
MPTYRRLFFRDLLLLETEGGGNDHSSILIYCPTCGDPWARLERASRWLGLPGPCPRHSTPFSIGGSFFNPGYPGTDPRDIKEVDLQDSHPDRGLGRFLLSNPLLLKHEAAMHAEWRPQAAETLP